MNFLSHFYFDRNTADCYLVLGTVMPDLLKNADKTVIIHPEKLTHTDSNVNSIIAGWNKHLLVDRYFHSSEFFLAHSHQLKKMLLPAIEGSPVKPFFLGHIALELILDNLLLTTGKVTADGFYDHLDGCDADVVDEFLTFSGLQETSVFFKFYEDFKKRKYLHSYADTKEIAYALKRICMRIWDDPFTPENEAQMNEVLMAYRESLIDDFMSIFDEIGYKLSDENEDKSHTGKPNSRPFINGDRPFTPLPERHGCVSAWLIFGLIVNSLVGLIYFLAANIPIHLPKVSIVSAYCIIIVSGLNVVFSIKLLKWKKIGFYGFCITAVFTFFININIGINPIASVIGLGGIAIFYAVLQIKKHGVSAWGYMK